MNLLQKYSLFFFCFAVFLLSGTSSVSAIENKSNDIITESFESAGNSEYYNSNDFIFFDSEITQPRSSVSYTTRLQHSSRRVDTEQKNNTSFIRAGKIINIATIFCFHNTFKLKHSFFSEPTNILVRFGKFII